MVNKTVENEQKKIHKFIKTIFDIRQYTNESLILALAQLSPVTLISKSKHKMYCLSRYYCNNDNDFNTLIILIVYNYRIIINQYRSSCYLVLLLPLFIYEYKYISLSNKRPKFYLNKDPINKLKQQKPIISISYIETYPPNKYINYSGVADINFFYNKNLASRRQDSVLSCITAPKVKSNHEVKKSLTVNESIKGKSFDEIYNTILKKRNQKQIIRYEGSKMLCNNIIFSALMKNKAEIIK